MRFRRAVPNSKSFRFGAARAPLRRRSRAARMLPTCRPHATRHPAARRRHMGHVGVMGAARGHHVSGPESEPCCKPEQVYGTAQ